MEEQEQLKVLARNCKSRMKSEARRGKVNSKGTFPGRDT